MNPVVGVEHTGVNTVTSGSSRGKSGAGQKGAQLGSLWALTCVHPFPPLQESPAEGLGKDSKGKKMSPQSATIIFWCTASLVAPHIKIPSSPLEPDSGRPGLFKAVPKHGHGPELDLFHVSWETQLVGTTALYWVQLCATHPLLEMKTFPLSKAFLKVDNL